MSAELQEAVRKMKVAEARVESMSREVDRAYASAAEHEGKAQEAHNAIARVVRWGLAAGAHPADLLRYGVPTEVYEIARSAAL